MTITSNQYPLTSQATFYGLTTPAAAVNTIGINAVRQASESPASRASTNVEKQFEASREKKVLHVLQQNDALNRKQSTSTNNPLMSRSERRKLRTPHLSDPAPIVRQKKTEAFKIKEDTDETEIKSEMQSETRVKRNLASSDVTCSWLGEVRLDCHPETCRDAASWYYWNEGAIAQATYYRNGWSCCKGFKDTCIKEKTQLEKIVKEKTDKENEATKKCVDTEKAKLNKKNEGHIVCRIFSSGNLYINPEKAHPLELKTAKEAITGCEKIRESTDYNNCEDLKDIHCGYWLNAVNRENVNECEAVRDFVKEKNITQIENIECASPLPSAGGFSKIKGMNKWVLMLIGGAAGLSLSLMLSGLAFSIKKYCVPRFCQSTTNDLTENEEATNGFDNTGRNDEIDDEAVDDDNELPQGEAQAFVPDTSINNPPSGERNEGAINEEAVNETGSPQNDPQGPVTHLSINNLQAEENDEEPIDENDEEEIDEIRSPQAQSSATDERRNIPLNNDGLIEGNVDQESVLNEQRQRPLVSRQSEDPPPYDFAETLPLLAPIAPPQEEAIDYGISLDRDSEYETSSDDGSDIASLLSGSEDEEDATPLLSETEQGDEAEFIEMHPLQGATSQQGNRLSQDVIVEMESILCKRVLPMPDNRAPPEYMPPCVDIDVSVSEAALTSRRALPENTNVIVEMEPLLSEAASPIENMEEILEETPPNKLKTKIFFRYENPPKYELFDAKKTFSGLEFGNRQIKYLRIKDAHEDALNKEQLKEQILAQAKIKGNRTLIQSASKYLDEAKSTQIILKRQREEMEAEICENEIETQPYDPPPSYYQAIINGETYRRLGEHLAAVRSQIDHKAYWKEKERAEKFRVKYNEAVRSLLIDLKATVKCVSNISCDEITDKKEALNKIFQENTILGLDPVLENTLPVIIHKVLLSTMKLLIIRVSCGQIRKAVFDIINNQDEVFIEKRLKQLSKEIISLTVERMDCKLNSVFEPLLEQEEKVRLEQELKEGARSKVKRQPASRDPELLLEFLIEEVVSLIHGPLDTLSPTTQRIEIYDAAFSILLQTMLDIELKTGLDDLSELPEKESVQKQLEAQTVLLERKANKHSLNVNRIKLDAEHLKYDFNAYKIKTD